MEEWHGFLRIGSSLSSRFNVSTFDLFVYIVFFFVDFPTEWAGFFSLVACLSGLRWLAKPIVYKRLRWTVNGTNQRGKKQQQQHRPKYIQIQNKTEKKLLTTAEWKFHVMND